ncbi:hypothetical protein AB0M28_14015 [Streptomyces sp. NPDC051940]|uniref:hypothetical protein n=1 Tax=Streptomyces sp. NPDC051940 TaxID=3155675 RepID=UPI00341F2B2E
MTSGLSSAAPAPEGSTFQYGPALKSTEVAHAAVSECFQAIGVHAQPDADGSCPTGYQRKIDGAYVWAGARSGDHAYFGTLSNAFCQATAGLIGQPGPHLVEDQNVCEFGESSGAAVYGPKMGDLRKPQVLRVNADTQQTEDITPDDPLLENVVGLRGAAAANDVVFMFGVKYPTLNDSRLGLAVFAFEGSTGKYLGSQLRTDLYSARGGIEGPDGNLYLAARRAPVAGDTTGGLGGVIERWTGTKSDPFHFETVAVLQNDAGYLSTFGNRLVVSGWMGTLPDKKSAAVGGPSKIWMSPEIPAGGLTSADKDSWTSVFSWDQYDPDPVLGKSVVWGGITEWRGDLYVGSYNHAGVTATESLWNAYGQPATEAARILDVTKSNRATAIFKISKPGTPEQKVTVLYGDRALPVYNPETKLWGNKPNLLGQTPKFGASGFGNPFNIYSWTFQVFQDKLYMATADMSGSLMATAFSVDAAYDVSDATVTSLEKVIGPTLFNTIGGGDVWRMDDPEKPAVAETLTGFGNHAQHGVRVFLPFEDKGVLYAGMGGGYNLRDGDNSKGGWSVNALKPGTPRTPLTFTLPNGALQGLLGAGTLTVG